MLVYDRIGLFLTEQICFSKNVFFELRILKVKRRLGPFVMNKCEDTNFQLWQAENHPIKLATQKIAWQKLDYTHYNSVEAGFVKRATDWKYSNAID